MRADGTSGITGYAGNYPLRALAFRVGKAKPSKNLDDERGSDAEARREQKSSMQSSQNETQHAPSWDAAQPNSAFVAQILGQILNDDERETASVRTAYSQPARLARACDIRV